MPSTSDNQDVVRALLAMAARRRARDAGSWAGMIEAWTSVLVENAEVRVAAVDDALGAWEAAALGALGGLGSATGVIWAVNEVEFGASDPLPIEEPLYGADAQQLKDLTRLGASLARHVYRRDLTWDQLGQGVAVPDREGPLRDLVFANAAALVTFLESVYAEGRRVIFTCIVHGGARDISLDTGGTPVFERSDGTGVMEAYALRWSSGHDLANVSGTRAYLDIRNSYELGFLEVMGTRSANCSWRWRGWSPPSRSTTWWRASRCLT